MELALRIAIVRGRLAGTEQLLTGRDVFAIGSAPDAHLRLEEEGVAPNHAQIFVDADRLFLLDVTGRGVYVNGRPEVQSPLKIGDEIILGRSLLKVLDQAPTPPARPRPTSLPAAELAVLLGPAEGRKFPIGDKITLGRGSTADVVLMDMKCSREHCRVERRADGNHYLVDLGATNGTKLNEVRLEARSAQLLKHSDVLRLGATVLEFRLADQPIRARPRAEPRPLAPTPPQSAPRVDSGKTFEIDLDALDEPVPSPTPSSRVDSRANTVRIKRTEFLKKPGAAAALEGELENMGFAQVVQFLNVSQKTGELTIRVGAAVGQIWLVSGNVIDAAAPAGGSAEQCFYRMARARKGHFEFHEQVVARDQRIRQGTLALLMEAMRLVDEATEHD